MNAGWARQAWDNWMSPRVPSGTPFLMRTTPRSWPASIAAVEASTMPNAAAGDSADLGALMSAA
jgi:hypothetical protein